MIRRPPISTLFPTRRSSDLACITRFFYLATPPDNYQPIIHMLHDTKLSEGCGQGSSKWTDRKSTRLNSSHVKISYAVFCLKKRKKTKKDKDIKSKIHF